MKTKAAIEKELADERGRCEELRKQCRELREERDTARASVKETVGHFADLKERLSGAENNAARLRGYLERVHEDDIVRDGLVEIEDENGKRMVPRRPQPMRPAMMNTGDLGIPDYDRFGREKKRTHWTSY